MSLRLQPSSTSALGRNRLIANFEVVATLVEERDEVRIGPPSATDNASRRALFAAHALFTLRGAVLGLKQPSSLYSRRNKRDLLRQPTKGGFSTIGTIVTIHRRGPRDRSSWTDRTMPKNFDPFKLSSAVRPKYWALRQRRASTELLVSTVCTMTSFGQAAHSISQALTRTLAFHSSRFSIRRPPASFLAVMRSLVNFSRM